MDIDVYLKVDECFRRFEMIERLKTVSKDREVIFLCVGNSKIWFDSFGPLIGSLLQMIDIEKYVYGNIKSSIVSSNLEEYIDMIYKFHVKPYIVVIDNAISNVSKPCLKIKEGSVKCACLSRAIEVGDMSIIYSLNPNHIKDSSNYKDMLSSVKNLARMIKFVFENNKA